MYSKMIFRKTILESVHSKIVFRKTILESTYFKASFRKPVLISEHSKTVIWKNVLESLFSKTTFGKISLESSIFLRRHIKTVSTQTNVETKFLRRFENHHGKFWLFTTTISKFENRHEKYQIIGVESLFYIGVFNLISLNFTITIKLFCLLQTQSLGACVLYRTHGRFTLVNQPPRSHNVLSRQHRWLPTWLWSSVINRRRTTEEGKWHSFITHISYIHLLEH